MSQTKPKWRLTPSLLNKYQELMDAELLWDKFYGSSDEPSITLADYEAKCEQELIDACNRVEFKSEAASRGTCLNELVDCIIEHRKQREDMLVERVYDNPDNGTLVALRTDLDGFCFVFDINFVRSLADYYKDAICQYRCEATIDTSFGPVILYGDADYIRRDVVYDLKSTARYSEYGKFDKGWQKHLYPWALVKSGEVQSVSGFEYTVALLKGKPVISGEIYKEWSDFHFEDSENKLREITESLVQWIENHRNQITHRRIFNKE